MRTSNIPFIYRKSPVSAKEIPDGDYDGSWSGYSIGFHVGDQFYEAHTNDGIRGCVECVVTLKAGVVTAITK